MDEDDRGKLLKSIYRTIQFHFVRSYEIKFVANKWMLSIALSYRLQLRMKFRWTSEEQQVYTACANETSIREKVLEKKVKVASNN